MSFKKPLPTWKAQGIQPPEHKLEEGWKAQDKPPAGWLNWQANTTYEALQELQDNAVDHRDVTSEPSANGVVRLNEAGKLNEAVFADAEHKEITLKPGVQIVESDQDTPFNFGSVQGRTLVNLLGRKGGCESLSDVQYPANSSTIELDASNKTSGMSSIKVTSISNQAYGVFIDTPIDNTKHYIAMADIKNGTSVSATLRASKTDYTVINNSVLSASKSFQTLYTALKPTDLTGIQTLRLYARFKEGAAGEVGNVDSLRLYEISQTEYEAIAMMSPEQVAAKYPYVGSMTNVTNPYAMATGDNLLPPFYEWNANGYAAGRLSIFSPYESVIVASGVSGQYEQISCSLPVSENTNFRIERGGTANRINIRFYDSSDVLIGNVTNESGDSNSVTFTTPNSTAKITVLLYSTNAGTHTIKNPMLTTGTEPKPFKPQSRSMWAAECQLAANPLDGSNADVLYVGDDGLPYMMEKWKKVTLDDKCAYGYSVSPPTGIKVVRVDRVDSGLYDPDTTATTFRGELLTYSKTPTSTWTAPNLIRVHPTNASSTETNAYLSVSNTDSGWGDAYQPTADEIKAYFLGWKMYTRGGLDPNATGTYDRTDGLYKGWVPLDSFDGTSYYGYFTGVGAPAEMPTTGNTASNYSKNRHWQPYRLQYLKATPTVESIRNYEQGLTLCAGSNVVEVGSGIVIREKSVPSKDHSGNWNLGNPVANSSSEGFIHKAHKVLSVYQNSSFDSRWELVYTNEYGALAQLKPPYVLDQTAVYHITYTMLDPTLSARINGNVATNLRGTVSDLVQRSGDVERRLSVVENQNAEKDNTVVWITPALLNGWTLSSNGVFPARYCKDGVGIVHVNGIVTGGATETVVFRLPAGYRPKTTIRTPTTIMSGTNVFIAYLDIKASGDVIAVFPTQSTHLSLQMSFLAEQ